MNIGIDGRAAKWYRGTGIGTYTHQLILSLNSIDNFNDYLIFLPDGSSLKDLKNNFHIESVKANLEENFWDEVSVPNILIIKIWNYIMFLKKVITLHDIIPIRMPETVSEKYLKLFNDELPNMLSQCEGIITVSEFSKKDISEEFNFPKEKIFVTPLAAEDIYKPMNKFLCKNILKEKYNIEDRFILYVGGFSPRKNIIGLIEAFSLITPKNRKNTKLVITGKKGVSYEKYKKRADELNLKDDVIFTDFIPVEDMPIFYNATELLVYPSFYEGFGLPPIEAMACGTPVVTSNVTSIPEFCSEAALLIDPYNIDELSKSIEDILNDSLLMLTLIKKGLSCSLNFSWRLTAEKTIAAYNSMLK